MKWKSKRRPQEAEIYCSAVVPAAGRASRMGGVDKILYEIEGVPILIHSLRAMSACPEIHEIVVVTSAPRILPVGELVRRYGLGKVRHVVLGGESRVESVLAGLGAIDPGADLVAIHDGARPLVTPALISQVIRMASDTGAAIPAVTPKDTVKEEKDGAVARTLERDSLLLVQTPQVFEPSLIKAALTRSLQTGDAITDDCAAVERMGMRVAVSPGAYENIKVTTKEDLLFCEAMLGGGLKTPPPSIRTTKYCEMQS